ncbi:nucleosome assembly protein 1-like 1 isoform X2 [Dreissena polymorpha]|uniref:nucleosome assembly protein 1-like 1 isoform X2 n=1 Tax=Dreissena polymorpha TaxID=45954 RepID=UPI002263E61D|nr:nucleosome assembly protein 1-like 1 isoform X2 [Dreissena polymorpha]
MTFLDGTRRIQVKMADPDSKVYDDAIDAGSEENQTSEEPSSQGDVSGEPAALASQLMRDPQMLAALQDKLGSMVGHNSGYIQSLPKSVKRRIKALKKLQFEATKIEAEFYREVHRLECQYAAKYLPLFEKRTTVVTGGYEPNDDEADWPSDDEKEDELANEKTDLALEDAKDEVEKKANIEEKKEENADSEAKEKDENTKGIPGFWLTIFKNVDMLSDMIQPADEPILNHLQDIKVEFKEKDPMGFTLQFIFEPNDYFENKQITKEYVMRSEPEEGDPFSFEGPEIIKCIGCKIDWKKGKNVTVKTVKKKQKHKASGTTRTIQKTVQNDSFFNFFSPPTPPEDEEMDEDTEALLAADFEIGHFIRERIVPRAVLYFTGEALENDDDYDEGDEEDGAEEGEYDEDADPDYSPGGSK